VWPATVVDVVGVAVVEVVGAAVVVGAAPVVVVRATRRPLLRGTKLKAKAAISIPEATTERALRPADHRVRDDSRGLWAGRSGGGGDGVYRGIRRAAARRGW
jgi:hypothetical protein